MAAKGIKTRQVTKDIRSIDKAATAAERFKSATIKTKNEAISTQQPKENSASEYASDKVTDTLHSVTAEVRHQAVKQGSKAFKTAKQQSNTPGECSAGEDIPADTPNTPYSTAYRAQGVGNQPTERHADIKTRDHAAPTDSMVTKGATGYQKQGRKKAVQDTKVKRVERQRVALHEQVQYRADLQAPLQIESRSALTSDSSAPVSDISHGNTRIKYRAIGKDALKIKSTVSSALPGKPRVHSVKAASQTIKTGAQTTQTAVKTAERAVAASKAEALKNTVKAAKSAQATRQTAQRATRLAQAAAQAAKNAINAIMAAVKSLYASVAAGGSFAVLTVVIVCTAAALIASPYGIFFSGSDSGTGYTMPNAVSQLNGEFTSKIDAIMDSVDYDTLDLDNNGSAAMISNWDDVLAVYAVRTSIDQNTPTEVATLSAEKFEILRDIFWNMNQISYSVESASHGGISTDADGNEVDDSWTEVILHITVTIKTYTDMITQYSLNAEQVAYLNDLMSPEYAELFMTLTGSYRDIELTDAEIQAIVKTLPLDLSEERKAVVLTAYSLLGKVNYFWGGKSYVLGWDSRWGTPMTVTSEGSKTTGTTRPFGLDCSGFVDWVFYNVSGGAYIIGQSGGASSQHSNCQSISWDEALPGDLVFYPDDSHVGIVCGFDDADNILVIHCASGYNNVVVTGTSGFVSIARPNHYLD